VVLAIDTNFQNDEWIVYVHGGRTPTERRTIPWAHEGTDRGAGEILLTSMNHDGTKNGFALDITSTLSKLLPIPIIASGGAGNMQHFEEVFKVGKADAALAASVFHFGEIKISDLKKYLKQKTISVRI
jgi:cyclase